MISSGTLLQLRDKATVGLRKMICNFASEERGLCATSRGIVGGEAVEIDAERERPFPIYGSKLRRHASENSRQDVSAAALGHAGISGGIDEDASIGRGEKGVKTFEDDVSVPSSCGFQGNSEAVGLHFVVRNTAETGHLARMRCERKQVRFSLGQVLGTAGEGIQAVSVDQERLLCFLDKRSYNALCFDMRSQARP